MKKDVNPFVALVVILVALGTVAYFWLFVFHGKKVGSVGPPPGISMSAGPPGPGERGPAPPGHRGPPGKDGKPLPAPKGSTAGSGAKAK